MKRSTIPGLMLAIIGLVLFAHQDIAQATQKRAAAEQTAVRRAHAAAATEQGFPVASLLAGLFFISGIGLAAITAHPLAQSLEEKPNTQS